MGPRTHTSRRAAAAVAAIAILLAGCGSSDSAPDPNSPEAAVESKIEAAQADVKAAPTDPAPLAALTKAHFQAANLESIPTGGYTDEGEKELRLAAQAWERYLALDPEPPDSGVAQMMAAAYRPGALDEPKSALHAQRILAESADPPSAPMFLQLAQMAYGAGDESTGDKAADRAIALTPKDERSAVREALKSAKAQGEPQQP